MQNCPKCLSSDIRYSYVNSKLETLWRILFGYRVYRCRACNWRGMGTPDPTEKATITRRVYSRLIEGLFVIALITFYVIDKPANPLETYEKSENGTVETQPEQVAINTSQDTQPQLNPIGDQSSSAVTDVQATTTVPPLESNTGSGDIYIQLDAFKILNGNEGEARIKADKFLAEMRTKLGELDKAYTIFISKGWVRVHVGPYADMNEAQRNADNLKSRLGHEPLIRRH